MDNLFYYVTKIIIWNWQLSQARMVESNSIPFRTKEFPSRPFVFRFKSFHIEHACRIELSFFFTLAQKRARNRNEDSNYAFWQHPAIRAKLWPDFSSELHGSIHFEPIKLARAKNTEKKKLWMNFEAFHALCNSYIFKWRHRVNRFLLPCILHFSPLISDL